MDGVLANKTLLLLSLSFQLEQRYFMQNVMFCILVCVCLYLCRLCNDAMFSGDVGGLFYCRSGNFRIIKLLYAKFSC